MLMKLWNKILNIINHTWLTFKKNLLSCFCEKSAQNQKLCQIYYGSGVKKNSRSLDQENTNQQYSYGFRI